MSDSEAPDEGPVDKILRRAVGRFELTLSGGAALALALREAEPAVRDACLEEVFAAHAELSRRDQRDRVTAMARQSVAAILAEYS